MAQRKTIDVARVRDLANTYLERSDPTMDRERVGVASLLEQVLHATDNYRGFRYLDGWEAVENGAYDETRRSYYGSSS